MKKIIGIFLFSLILVGCGKSAEDIAKEKQAQEQALKIKQEQERKLKEQAELKKVEDAVRYYHKDGDSAKFRNVIKNCGEVNAKNSWGAYAGFSRFIVKSDKQVIFDGPDNYYFDSLVKLYCHKDYLAKFPVETSEEIAIDASPTEQISGVAAEAAAGETLENETRSVSKPKKEEVAVEELTTEDTTSDNGSSENY
ncbi:hypothetical protein ACV7CH_001683 [Acinetobacter baumannii]